MPGKKQLKQFSKDVLDLGDEVKIRAMRGEKPAVYPIPETISDADDSQDFVIGMPEPPDSETASSEGAEPAAPAASEAAEQPSSDIPSIPMPGEDIPVGPSDIPDLDEILKSVSEPKGAPVSQSAVNPFTDSGAAGVQSGKTESVVPENIADMDLDALLGNLNGKDGKLDDLQPLEELSSGLPEQAEPAEAAPEQEVVPPAKAAVSDEPAENSPDEKESPDENFYNPDADFEDEDGSAAGGIDLTADMPKTVQESYTPPRTFKYDAALSPDEENKADGPDLSEKEEGGIPEGFEDLQPEELSPSDAVPAGESVPADEFLHTDESVPADKPISADENVPGIDEKETVDFSVPENIPEPAQGTDNFPDLSFPGDNAPDQENVSSAFDADAGESSAAQGGTLEPSEEAPIETYDTSELDDLDFSSALSTGEKAADGSAPADGSNGFGDFNIKETDAQLNGGKSDFELGSDDEFSIPGFSDTAEVDFNKIAQKQAEAKAAASAAQNEKNTKTGAKPKNTLTDEEYVRFKNNLSIYPLNVRIAVEDLIVKNEFTDDAIFEVIQRVLKKQSARQLASYLEKMLDISLPVPRDYEHRTFEQYETYKSTLEYQLKNRIIPAALIGLGIGFIVFFLFITGRQFIYRPIKAGSLYRQGYSLLESNEYPQAEQKFKDAVIYRESKKWFFKYARGYRMHKQYERSALVYNDILRRFNNDKYAGLEYADMQWHDLSDYSGAVRIVNDKMLLYHVNDKDGLLELGDIYLDWGDNGDPEKYENARETYATLVNLFGSTDLYLSRMMRYFIRKDNLPEVLRLKELFFPKKKSLGSQDLTELSGYLFDKSNASLAPSEAYLREKITDIKALMERAIRADPENPAALYNMARYFIQMSNQNDALTFLDASQSAFSKAASAKLADTYRWIDTYRLEGEIYVKQQEILKAAETFTDGISLFTNNTPALPGNHIVGKLYSDMADIDYFKYNNSDAAYNYYKAALENDNDTPAIRYKIGAILYEKKQFPEALGSFITTAELVPRDNNLLMALGTVLMQRNSYNAAKGYYEELLKRLDSERAEKGLLMPQVEAEDASLVEMYMKASNNLGVSLYNLASRTGDSNLNGSAMVQLSTSLRAWDALTRNPETMVRLPGINLAEQNIQYITKPVPNFEPAIYPDIPRTLEEEKGFN